MKFLCYAAIALSAISGFSPPILTAADYDRYQTLAVDDDGVDGVEFETDCPTYPLHPDYSCLIDLTEDEPPYCSYPVEVIAYEPDPDGGDLHLALLELDMKHYSEALVTVMYTANPYGWITNLGNSPSNNGCGGDAADRSFDGEFWVIQPPAPPHPPFDYDLGAETNDFGYQTFGWGEGRVASLRLRDMLEQDSPTVVTYVVRDKSLQVISGGGQVDSEFTGVCVFRIDTGLWDPEADGGQGACNDGLLHLGLNRVVASIARRGQGAMIVWITLIGDGPSPDEEEEME